MDAEIKVLGLPELKAALAGYERAFNPNSREQRALFNQLGRAGRDLVRNQITTQGRGTWKPLSKWTQAKTGRRKALITERNRITFRVKPRRVEIVYEERSNDWNLTKHHKGFVNQGFQGKVVTIPLKRPSALGLTRTAITIRKARPAEVPARNVWTDLPTLRNMTETIASKWVLDVLRKRGK